MQLWKDKCNGTVVFVTRQYGGVKLGFKRFEIVRDITKAVCKSLHGATDDSRPSPQQLATPQHKLKPDGHMSNRKHSPKGPAPPIPYLKQLEMEADDIIAEVQRENENAS